jgi:rhomboid family protein
MIPLHDDNPTTRRPIVTVAIIVASVIVFLLQISQSQVQMHANTISYGLVPALLLGRDTLPPELARIPPELTILTSMFMHGSWLHIGGNMLYLWIFGNNIEDAVGHLRFVLFYLACGTAAALAQAFSDPSSTVPMVGASGAIAGVLGAYLLLFPRAHVLVLIPLGLFTQLIRVPALIVLGFWFLLQFVQGAMTAGQSGGVAYWAHIGGFVAGVVLIPILRERGVPLFGGGPGRGVRGPWG